jgi:dienelactone hydrolase
MATEGTEQLIHVPVDSILLEGVLRIPIGTNGIVLFAHGSGSSRHSPRNKYVAEVLHKGGLGTLLIDLLSKEEDAVYETRFDIDLLSRRLRAASGWLKNQTQTRDLCIGYFGASTGAAAALKAAAAEGDLISAVVSRGGRPDLAEADLDRVQAPTLLIVGSNDDVVIELNRYAYKKLKAKKELQIISDASHLFEEPGTLEEVSQLAAQWFKDYLCKE